MLKNVCTHEGVPGECETHYSSLFKCEYITLKRKACTYPFPLDTRISNLHPVPIYRWEESLQRLRYVTIDYRVVSGAELELGFYFTCSAENDES